jgi:hypothetical protein
MPNISESFLIGYDKSDGRDYSCLTVVKRVSKERLIVVNTLFGKEADEMYEKLVTENPNPIIHI